MLSPCPPRRDYAYTKASGRVLFFPVLIVALSFACLSQPVIASAASGRVWGQGSLKLSSNFNGAETAPKSGALALRGGVDVVNASEKAPVMSFAAPAATRSDAVSSLASATTTERKKESATAATTFSSSVTSSQRFTASVDAPKTTINSTNGILKSSLTAPYKAVQEAGSKVDIYSKTSTSTALPKMRAGMSAEETTSSRSMSSSAADSSFSGPKNELHQRLEGIETRFKELMEGCKLMHAKTLDPGMKRKLELRISDLEIAEEILKKVPKLAGPTQEYSQHDRFNIERVEYQLDAVEYDVGSVLPKIGDQALVHVTFVLECDCTELGDKVLLTGEGEELGSWDVHDALEMSTTPTTYPKWSVTVPLRAGEMVAYKFLIGKPSDMQGIYSSLLWEGHMGNRELKVSRNTHKPQVVEERFVKAEDHVGNVADSLSPSFVHMHTHAFQDPEYVCFE
jgi:hypothetical protein